MGAANRELRLSRKLIYAAGLLACFSCDIEEVLASETAGPKKAGIIVEHLERRFSMPPLDIVATALLGLPELQEAARDLFGAYDRFLALLNDDDKRKQLEDLEPDASGTDPIYGEARALSRQFQTGLDGIFFGKHERLAELTRMYGVF